MKTDWAEGEVFCYCTNKDSEDRGTLVGKAKLGDKLIVERVYSDAVEWGGWLFYFDEIKPVIQVKGGK